MAEKPHVNIITAGHVDHGKSTLLGRLLFDSGFRGLKELRAAPIESLERVAGPKTARTIKEQI